MQISRPKYSVKQARWKLLRAAEKLEREGGVEEARIFAGFPKVEEETRPQRKQHLSSSLSSASLKLAQKKGPPPRSASASALVPSQQPQERSAGATRLVTCGVRSVSDENAAPDDDELRTRLEAVRGVVGEGDFVVGVACAERATLAVTAAGRLVGFGPQLMIEPSLFGGRYKAKSVACGSRHAAVVCVDGSLWTWGAGHRGQLGHGDVTSRAQPCRVEAFDNSLASVTSASCGGTHTAAIVADRRGSVAAGRLATWGDDRVGQLGHGARTTGDDAAEDPASWRPRFVDAFDRRAALVRRVACGLHHTLAIAWEHILPSDQGAPHEDDHHHSLLLVSPTNRPPRVFARILAWGFGDEGRLGTGDETTCREPARVLLPVGFGAYAKAIAAGDRHSMALMSDGRVFAWGDNTFGQLGLGTASTTPVTFPTEVSPLSSSDDDHDEDQHAVGSDTPAVVACGARHSAITTLKGHVLTWGFGEEGQLGGGPSVAQLNAPRGATAKPTRRHLGRDDDDHEDDCWSDDQDAAEHHHESLETVPSLASSSLTPSRKLSTIMSVRTAKNKRTKPTRWVADSVALGVRHTVVLCRNARAGVTREALAEAAGGDDDRARVASREGCVVVEPEPSPPKPSKAGPLRDNDSFLGVSDDETQNDDTQEEEEEDDDTTTRAVPPINRELLEERLRETRDRRRAEREAAAPEPTPREEPVVAAAAAAAEKTVSPAGSLVEHRSQGDEPVDDEVEDESPPSPDQAVVPLYGLPDNTARPPYSDVYYRESQDTEVCYVANAARRAEGRRRRSREGDQLKTLNRTRQPALPKAAPPLRRRSQRDTAPPPPTTTTKLRPAESRKQRIGTPTSCYAPPAPRRQRRPRPLPGSSAAAAASTVGQKKDLNTDKAQEGPASSPKAQRNTAETTAPDDQAPECSSRGEDAVASFMKRAAVKEYKT